MRALEGKIHRNCRAGPAYLRPLASGENTRGPQCRQLSNLGRLAALRGDLQRLVAHSRFEECAPGSLKYRPAKVGGLWCQLSRLVASSGAGARPGPARQWLSRGWVVCALRAPRSTAEQSTSQAPPVTPSGNGRSRAPPCACAPETVLSERFSGRHTARGRLLPRQGERDTQLACSSHRGHSSVHAVHTALKAAHIRPVGDQFCR